jgi:hypothetical protein
MTFPGLRNKKQIDDVIAFRGTESIEGGVRPVRQRAGPDE